MFAVKQWALYS